MTHAFLFLGLLILISGTATGCDREAHEELQTSDIEDSKRATLEQFLSDVQQMLSHVPQQTDAVYDLYHFSADWQREEIAWVRELESAKGALRQACMDQFGRVPEWGGLEFTRWPSHDMEVVEEGTGSAIVRLSGPDHPDRLWYLIAVDGEWHIDASKMVTQTPPELLETRNRAAAEGRRLATKYRAMAEAVRQGKVSWEQILDS